MARSRPAEFEVSSLVPAPPEKVWERIITPAGINHELRPWMRMTRPRGFERLDPESVELEPGRRFLERSPMLSQRSWQHERIVEPAEGGSRVTDRIRMEPRLGLPGAPLRPLFRAVFRHRHRRLRAWFAH